MKKLIAIAALIATAQASAFWGNGWDNNYNRGYGRGYGYGNTAATYSLWGRLAGRVGAPVTITAGTAAGVLAHAAEIPEADLGELMRVGGPGAGTPPFLVAVDSVTDPGNLGAIVRSCDGAGVTGVLLPMDGGNQAMNAGATPGRRPDAG